jgi:hypothetical protein
MTIDDAIDIGQGINMLRGVSRPTIGDALDLVEQQLATCGFNWLTGQEARRVLREACEQPIVPIEKKRNVVPAPSEWPEPPPALPAGLTRELFVTMPLGFKLNRSVLRKQVAEGIIPPMKAEWLLHEDECREAINAVLNYFSYWQLQYWSRHVECTGRWVDPPSPPNHDRAAVWKALYEAVSDRTIP